MKEIYFKKGFAIFVIALFITIPIYISDVYASLNIEYAYGSAKNNGWVKKYDDLYVSVLTDTTNASKIKLSGIEFDSCSQGKCYLELNDMTFFPTRAGSNQWEAELKNHETEETQDLVLSIDSQPPSGELIKSYQQDDKLIVEYSLDEENLQKIDFYLNNNLVKSVTSPTGNEEFSVDDGEYNIKLIASDIAGNTLSLTNYLSVDLTPPKITDVSFLYDNNEIDWTNGQILRGVHVIVKYNEKIMNGSCFGDFSSLASGVFSSSYSNYAGISSGESCIYSGLIFEKQDGNPKNFFFKARDLIGNVDEESYSKTFKYDGESPVINSFESGYVDADGKSWIASNVGDDIDLMLNTNKIYLKFTESGSGISANRVYIDLNGIYDNGNNTYKAGSCGSSSCEFLVPIKKNSNLKSGTVVIPYYSTDNAGNSFEGKKQLNIYVDNNAPVIDEGSMIITTTNGVYDCTVGECKQGDDIIIEFNVTDEGAPGDSIEVYGDLSKVGGYEEDAFSCSKLEEHKFSCTKTINDIVGPYDEITIPITLKDLVGNVHIDDGSVSFGVAYNEQLYSEDIPLLWSLDDYSIYPDLGIDAGVDLPYDIYVPISFNEHSQYENMDLTMLKADNLWVESNDEDGIVNNIQLYHSPDYSSLWLVVDVSDSKIKTDLDSLQINASIDIISRFKKGEQYVITEPQTIFLNKDGENITISIYDNPMGTINENTQKKIQSVREGLLLKSGGVISTFKTVLKAASTLCSLGQLLNSIPLVIEFIGYIMKAVPGWGTAASKLLTWTADSFRGTSTWNKLVGGVTEWSCAVGSCSLFNKIMTDTKLSKQKGGFAEFMRGWSELGASGIPFVDDTNEYNKAVENLGINTLFNPNSNIFLATITLCIPGIINNLEKARQIECHYGYCMEVQVPNGEALPLQCDMMRGRQWCEYYYGALYQFMLGNVAEQVFNAVKKMSADPMAVVLNSLSSGCVVYSFATKKEKGILWLPAIASWVINIGEIVALGFNLKNFNSPSLGDYDSSDWQIGLYATVATLVTGVIIGRTANAETTFCDAVGEGIKLLEIANNLASIGPNINQIGETWSGDNDWCGKWDAESKFDEDGNYQSEEETGGDDSEE